MNMEAMNSKVIAEIINYAIAQRWRCDQDGQHRNFDPNHYGGSTGLPPTISVSHKTNWSGTTSGIELCTGYFSFEMCSDGYNHCDRDIRITGIFGIFPDGRHLIETIDCDTHPGAIEELAQEYYLCSAQGGGTQNDWGQGITEIPDELARIWRIVHNEIYAQQEA